MKYDIIKEASNCNFKYMYLCTWLLPNLVAMAHSAV